jgi:hypothetical protein
MTRWACLALLVACGGRSQSTPPPPDAAPGAAGDAEPEAEAGAMAESDATVDGSSFPVGLYGQCVSSSSSGLDGANGTIDIALSGSQVTLTFPGDAAPSGALTFVLTTSTSGTLAPPGQSLVGYWSWCGAGITDTGIPIDPTPRRGELDVTSGAVTVDGSTVFVSIVGEAEPIDEDCSGGQRVTATFTCTKE